MENTVRTIVLHSKEVKNGEQKFISSSAEINGKWYKIKFTKDCDGIPEVRGLYELTIDFDECSIEAGRKFTNKRGRDGVENDTIWVNHIVGLRQYTEEELKALNRTSMLAIFGDNNNGNR